jgi:hypothetical protein
MNYDRFIISKPITLFKANRPPEFYATPWEHISAEKRKGLRPRMLVSVPEYDTFRALKFARDLNAHIVVDGKAVDPNNFREYLKARARSARTADDVADSMPKIAKIFAEKFPYKIDDKAELERQIRHIMPERQITNDKTLKDLAADYLHQAIVEFDLETRDLIQVREGNPNVIEAPTGREELRKLIMEQGGVFVMNWQLGEGKSEFCDELLKRCQHENRTAAMLAPRKSHHTKHLGEPTHYQIIKQTKNAGTVAVGTSNGLCYLPIFEKYRTGASILIADEYEQNRTHNAGKAFLSGSLRDRALITSNMNNFILRAADLGAFIGVDAQMSEHSVNELAQMTRKKIIISRSNRPLRKRKLKLHRDHQSCVSHGQGLLSKGGRIVLFADMSHNEKNDDFGGVVKTMLSAKPDADVLVIDKSYVQDPDNAQALKNINKTIEAHDLIVISPAINSGFSITTDNIDAVFVLASGTVLPTEFVQTLGRFRALNEIHVSFEVVERWLPIYPNDVLKSLANSEILATSYSAHAVEHLRTQPGVDQVIKQIARDNKMRQQYPNRALIMAKYAGFEMERVVAKECNGDSKSTGGMTLNKGKSISEEERSESVMGIRKIGESESKRIREKNSKTPDEEIQLENFDMRVAYRTPDLTMYLLAADRKGRMRDIIKNWKTATKDRTEHMTVADMQCRRVIRKLFDCIDININTIKPNHRTSAQNLKAWAEENKIVIVCQFSGSLITLPMGIKNQEDRAAFFTEAQADKFAKWIKGGEMKISGNNIRNRDALKAFGKPINHNTQGPCMVKKLLTEVLGLAIYRTKIGGWKFSTTEDFDVCYAMATADVDPNEYKKGDDQAAQDAEIDAEMQARGFEQSIRRSG